MHFQKLQNNKTGFTLAELLVVVAITIILAGFGFVAVINYRWSLKVTEMDDTARSIFVAAQNHLTAAKADGTWDQIYKGKLGENFEDATYKDLKNASDWPAGIDTKGHDFYYVVCSGDGTYGTVLNTILPFGSIDDTVRSNSYVIEFDAKTATVYGVFYTDSKASTIVSDVTTLIAAGGRTSKDVRKSAKVNGVRKTIGYYGGAAAKVFTANESRTASLKITNNETLTAELTTDADFSSDYVTLQFAGQQSSAKEKYVIKKSSTENNYAAYKVDISTGQESTSANTSMQITSAGNVYTIVLDDIKTASHHFHDILPSLLPGEDFTITVTVSSGTAKPATAGKTTNSLFDSIKANDTGYTAYIGNGRHLQNLAVGVSSVNSKDDQKVFFTQAEQLNEINWSNFTGTAGVIYKSDNNKLNAGEFLSIINSNLIQLNGKGYKIISLNAAANGSNAGLFAEAGISSPILIENVFLENEKVVAAEGANAGSLIGNSGPNTIIASCGVNAVNGYANASVTANNGSAGGLIGKLDLSNKFNRRQFTELDTANGVIDDAVRSGVTSGTSTNDSQTPNDVIYASYSSVAVSGKNAGGMIGEVASAGTTTLVVRDSYAGGCTNNEGVYDSNNISGTNNAGGFAGSISGSIDFENCYTTASVSGVTAGGFTGTQSAAVTYNNNYATGKVAATGQNGAGTFIGFLGAGQTVSSGDNYILSGVNTSTPKVGNGGTATFAGIKEGQKGSAPFTGNNTSTATTFTYNRPNEAYPFKAVNWTASYDNVKPSSRNALYHYGDWPEANVSVTITIRKTVNGLYHDGAKGYYSWGNIDRDKADQSGDYSWNDQWPVSKYYIYDAATNLPVDNINPVTISKGDFTKIPDKYLSRWSWTVDKDYSITTGLVQDHDYYIVETVSDDAKYASNGTSTSPEWWNYSLATSSVLSIDDTAGATVVGFSSQHFTWKADSSYRLDITNNYTKRRANDYGTVNLTKTVPADSTIIPEFNMVQQDTTGTHYNTIIKLVLDNSKTTVNTSTGIKTYQYNAQRIPTGTYYVEEINASNESGAQSCIITSNETCNNTDTWKTGIRTNLFDINGSVSTHTTINIRMSNSNNSYLRITKNINGLHAGLYNYYTNYDEWPTISYVVYDAVTNLPVSNATATFNIYNYSGSNTSWSQSRYLSIEGSLIDGRSYYLREQSSTASYRVWRNPVWYNLYNFDVSTRSSLSEIKKDNTTSTVESNGRDAIFVYHAGSTYNFTFNNTYSKPQTFGDVYLRVNRLSSSQSLNFELVEDSASLSNVWQMEQYDYDNNYIYYRALNIPAGDYYIEEMNTDSISAGAHVSTQSCNASGGNYCTVATATNRTDGVRTKDFEISDAYYTLVTMNNTIDTSTDIHKELTFPNNETTSSKRTLKKIPNLKFTVYDETTNLPVDTAAVTFSNDQFNKYLNNTQTQQYWQNGYLTTTGLVNGNKYYIRESGSEVYYTSTAAGYTGSNDWHYNLNLASSLLETKSDNTVSVISSNERDIHFTFNGTSKYALSVSNTYDFDADNNKGVVQLKKTVPSFAKNWEKPQFELVQKSGESGANTIQLVIDETKTQEDTAAKTITYYYSAVNVPSGTYYVQESNKSSLASSNNVEIAADACVINGDYNTTSKDTYCTITEENKTDVSVNPITVNNALTNITMSNSYTYTMPKDAYIGLVYYEKVGDNYYYHGYYNAGKSIDTRNSVKTVDFDSISSSTGLIDVTGRTASATGYLVFMKKEDGIKPSINSKNFDISEIAAEDNTMPHASDLGLDPDVYSLYKVTVKEDPALPAVGGVMTLNVTGTVTASKQLYLNPYLGDSVSLDDARTTFAVRSADQWNWLASINAQNLTTNSKYIFEQQLDISFPDSAGKGNGTIDTLNATLNNTKDANGNYYSMSNLTAPLINTVGTLNAETVGVVDGLQLKSVKISNDAGTALFGTNYGTISNVIVTNIDTAKDGFITTNYAAISNCSVAASSIGGNGFVGENAGTINASSVEGSTTTDANGMVTVSPLEINQNGFAGTNNDTGSIDNCSVAASSIDGNGFVGENAGNGTINASSVEGSTTTDANGVVTSSPLEIKQNGFVGTNDGYIYGGTVKDAFLIGSLTDANNVYNGFAGTNSGTIGTYVETNQEDVISSVVTKGTISGNGFVGTNSGTIEDAKVTSTADTIKDPSGNGISELTIMQNGFVNTNTDSITGSSVEASTIGAKHVLDTDPYYSGFVADNSSKIDACTVKAQLIHGNGFAGTNEITGQITNINVLVQEDGTGLELTIEQNGFVYNNVGIINSSSVNANTIGENGFVNINSGTIGGKDYRVSVTATQINGSGFVGTNNNSIAYSSVTVDVVNGFGFVDTNGKSATIQNSESTILGLATNTIYFGGTNKNNSLKTNKQLSKAGDSISATNQSTKVNLNWKIANLATSFMILPSESTASSSPSADASASPSASASASTEATATPAASASASAEATATPSASASASAGATATPAATPTPTATATPEATPTPTPTAPPTPEATPTPTPTATPE